MSPMDIEFKPLLTDSRPRDSEALAQETRDGLLQGRCPSAYRSVIFWISITVHGIITITLALALYNDHDHDRHLLREKPSCTKLDLSFWGTLMVLPRLYSGLSLLKKSTKLGLTCTTNVMRKALRADYYADPETGDIGNIVKNELHGHLDHCVDMLRQALMCSADISPLVWQWSEKARIAKPASDVMHTCRNFDNIVEWAKTNRIKHHFDTTARIEDTVAPTGML
ncbi:hypothetical protein PHLCEN_2v5510 [Hermanssonia centrifuga]|uniref:Uncharacterized protein n=1 Tax=Hermanssonia centrifuga TaxID=98765 RepID=A0A2R6P2B6_9APHY|nr:hypothetical protein PHLCEN_2v5510 [Hermanssonia centrifuga]